MIVLPDRCVIDVTGEDAAHLLHNVLTPRVEGMADDVAVPGALLTPQGKIMFDFMLSKAGDQHFVVDIRDEIAEAFLQRMIMYKLRSKVDFAKRDQAFVAVRFDGDSGASDTDSSLWLADRRFADGAVMRAHVDGVITGGDVSAWNALRVAHGVAESGADFDLGDAFPHDVSMDQTGGVDFRKGCYVGQEVVSRMHHKGTPKRRVMIASADAGLPATGTDVTADGKPVGTLGTVAANKAIIVGRIDRVADAMRENLQVMAGDVALTLSLPPNVTYSWPDDAAEPSDG